MASFAERIPDAGCIYLTESHHAVPSSFIVHARRSRSYRLAMSFHHQPTVLHGKEVDVLTDEKAGVRLTVARAGAEPVSLAVRAASGEWRGFLHRDGDLTRAAGGWNNHSTLMGYYIHRIKGERTTYRGHEIRGATHSFLRHKRFAPPSVALADERASLQYRMTPDQFAPHEYPLHVAMTLTYALEAGTLRTSFHFENLEREQSAHVSFGLHPGFAVEALETCEVLLPPGIYVRHLAPDNFLSGETVRFEHPGGPMPFRKAELPGSFLLEVVQVPEPVFTVRDATRQTDLRFEEVPFVTLWSDGGPFICLEPCWGLPDHHEQRPFESKLGMQEIPAQGTLERSFTITPRVRS